MTGLGAEVAAAIRAAAESGARGSLLDGVDPRGQSDEREPDAAKPKTDDVGQRVSILTSGVEVLQRLVVEVHDHGRRWVSVTVEGSEFVDRSGSVAAAHPGSVSVSAAARLKTVLAELAELAPPDGHSPSTFVEDYARGALDGYLARLDALSSGASS